VEIIDYKALLIGRCLGRGAEGAVFEARWQVRRAGRPACVPPLPLPEPPAPLPRPRLRPPTLLASLQPPRPANPPACPPPHPQDSPVAIKEGPSLNEIEIYLASGSHDNVVAVRGLTQKVRRRQVVGGRGWAGKSGRGNGEPGVPSLTLLCPRAIVLCPPQDDGTWCLVLEYCGRGTLDTLLHHGSGHGHGHGHGHHGGGAGGGERFEAELPKLLPLARGIARGMLHLHSRRPAILHRDLKPGARPRGVGGRRLAGGRRPRLASARRSTPLCNTQRSPCCASHRPPRPPKGNIFVGHGGVMKIGDFGMSRHVMHTPDSPPPAPGAAPGTAPGMPRAGGTSGGGGGSGGGAHAAQQQPGRTLTPGVVGTVVYSAPEVLDESLQLPGAPADRILKVRLGGCEPGRRIPQPILAKPGGVMGAVFPA
jgi:serine/threonine protein kinase